MRTIISHVVLPRRPNPTTDRRPPTAARRERRGHARAGRYQLLGEIARGGMGPVLRGRDPDLGRDLAVKVLLDEHRDQSDLVDRFVEEAQICGQLQHPGVVPVYELGTLADHRPYFAMKLVKGQHARRPPGRASLAAPTTCRGSCRSSRRFARRWPTPTPAA